MVCTHCYQGELWSMKILRLFIARNAMHFAGREYSKFYIFHFFPDVIAGIFNFERHHSFLDESTTGIKWGHICYDVTKFISSHQQVIDLDDTEISLEEMLCKALDLYQQNGEEGIFLGRLFKVGVVAEVTLDGLHITEALQRPRGKRLLQVCLHSGGLHKHGWRRLW